MRKLIFNASLMLFILFAMVSCQKETIEITQKEELNYETIVEVVVVPEDFIGNDVIEWAKNLPDNEFSEYVENEEEQNVIESRWCTSWSDTGVDYYQGGVCYCCVDYVGCGNYCDRICDIYEKYCGGWSGGVYKVIRYTQYRNCNC